ncbi:FprA family A-type flavoprotein [Candidatus Stoquefichus massiliensis]|uniref:FprA family A-type flavoprotein n=1 Tax=Candidatus Stoquefichus massiliensis TaxID=1470350 RepID=UPI0004827970|nr:MBL fold metallo-hydrolase [Candidatus Stoquefichus massiliensis]
MNVTDSIKYIGVYDKDLDLFEGQYPLSHGVTYNSYMIMDEKIAIMDTVDRRGKDAWLANLEKALAGRNPDYLIVSHMEPDHGACVQIAAKKYPHMKIVGNVKTFTMIDEYFELNDQTKRVLVKEGDTLELGKHILQFMMAPMVHWPEVMMTYDQTENILFSADAFGTFYDDTHPWINEARRYYTNIVGKYGLQVKNVLKKAQKLKIDMICPLHGPVLKEDIAQYIRYYELWSTYTPEESGILIACASIHGHTMEAAQILASLLEEQGEKVILRDLSRTDVSYVIADAFMYDRIVLAASSYDGGVFCPMEQFIHHLKSKNFQNRSIAFIENGTWAPSANKAMKEVLDCLKGLDYMEPSITIRGALKEESVEELKSLAKIIMEGGCIDEVCV